MENEPELPELGSLEELEFSELQDVALLAFVKAAANDKGPDTILQPDDLIDISGVNDFLIDKAIEGLKDRKYISLISQSYLEVTAKGLNYYESQIKKKGTFLNKNIDRLDIIILDNRPQMCYFIGYKVTEDWKRPDEVGELSTSEIEEIKTLLEKCLEEIRKSNLSQHDRAQAEGQIQAAREIAETPTPAWGIVRKITGRFTDSFVGEFAKRIVQIIWNAVS